MSTSVLVCDDSKLARRQLARSLPDDWDIKVEFAEDGVHCIEQIKKIQPEILFLDLNMPEMDGYEVLQAKLPALVTVSNELGEPRYATLRGIMSAARKIPTIYTIHDLGVTTNELAPKIKVEELALPDSNKNCEVFTGEDDPFREW